MKVEKNANEAHNNCPQFDEVNYGASTSGYNMTSETNQEPNKSETKTQNKKNPKNDLNSIPLTPEQVAVEQILWVNKMYAIQMAEYWQS